MQLKTYLIYCLILYLVLVIRTLLYIEKEKTRRAEKGDRRNRKRENQGEGCRRPIASSSPLLLLRLMPPPSTPSPAAHQVAPPTKEREERAPCPAMGGCHHHHLATTSPPIDQQQGRASTVCHSARLVLVIFPVPIFLQMVRGVQRARQGRAIPSSSPRRPSPPCRCASA